MNAKKFVDQQGNAVWTKELADGRTQTSVCIEVNDETLDLNSGYVREEKSLVWIKGMSAEAVTRQQDAVIKAVNTGAIKPYRAFSKEPFYPEQPMDINPSTNEELGRYSQVRLCPANQHSTLHRQYVTVATANPVEEPATQPVVNAQP